MSNKQSTVTIESLRSVPLFASLDDNAAADLARLLAPRDASKGARLFEQGDRGDSMYLIKSGCIRISVHDADGREVTLSELRQGDFFGEMALIDGKLRSAAATAIEDSSLSVLSRESFLSFIRSNADVAIELLSAVTDRLRQTDELFRRRVARNANDEEAKRMTLADRMADLIAEFGGSWKFIGAAIAFLIFWVLLNTWLMHDRSFDPYPYVLLNLVLGMITGLQAPIIMMSQNRQAEKDRLRSDLDYQVNLKNELSLTEVLRRIDVLESERLPALFEELNEKLAATNGSRTLEKS